ncbi:hypothetical protein [Streptomyces regalis]|uniref:Uncharacterized protein n=1 Tax=Streptomyces regalis TaxID=68262 RepID=A0A124G745_9ACTN|nr:hypothetical protein [Streptomyces regalis]KUL21625.1 hypothetical protein ADL12_44320 [Streptomyces regalis]
MDGWVALLLVGVVAGGFLAWYAHYPFLPSRWRYGWPDSKHRPDRRALAKARRARRVQVLSRAREELHQQGSGQEGEPELWLWPLGLVEHELLFLKGEASEGQGDPRVDERLPLADVTVKLDHSQDHVYIRVTRPDGTRRSQPYPRHQEIAADALVEAIHNQVVDHEKFRRRDAELVAEIRRAEAVLRAARDTWKTDADGLRPWPPWR